MCERSHDREVFSRQYRSWVVDFVPVADRSNLTIKRTQTILDGYVILPMWKSEFGMPSRDTVPITRL